MIGRAMSDIQRMAGTFESPVTDGEYAVIEGEAPVSEMRDYAMDVSPPLSAATSHAMTPNRSSQPPLTIPKQIWTTPPTRSSAPTVPATPSNGIKSPNSPTSTTPCEVVTTKSAAE